MDVEVYRALGWVDEFVNMNVAMASTQWAMREYTKRIGEYLLMKLFSIGITVFATPLMSDPSRAKWKKWEIFL